MESIFLFIFEDGNGIWELESSLYGEQLENNVQCGWVKVFVMCSYGLFGIFGIQYSVNSCFEIFLLFSMNGRNVLVFSCNNYTVVVCIFLAGWS